MIERIFVNVIFFCTSKLQTKFFISGENEGVLHIGHDDAVGIIHQIRSYAFRVTTTRKMTVKRERITI